MPHEPKILHVFIAVYFLTFTSTQPDIAMPVSNAISCTFDINVQ